MGEVTAGKEVVVAREDETNTYVLMNFQAEGGLRTALAQDPISHATETFYPKTSLPENTGSDRDAAYVKVSEKDIAKNSVRALPKFVPHVVPSTGHQPLRDLNERRKKQHNDSIERWHKIFSDSSRLLELNIKQAASDLQSKFAANDLELEKILSQLQDGVLEYLQEPAVLQVWEDVAAQTELREYWIIEFGTALEAVEQERRQFSEKELTELMATLLDTAFVLAPIVQRIIEEETQEVNLVIINNRRTNADLLARLRKREVERERQQRALWEQKFKEWHKHLFDQAIARFKETFNSPTYSDPPKRRTMYKQLRQQQRVYADRRLALMGSTQNLVPPTLTRETAKEWITEMRDLQEETEHLHTNFSANLRTFEATLAAEGQKLLWNLKQELRVITGQTEEEIEQDPIFADECTVMVEEMAAKYAELTERVINTIEGQAQVYYEDGERAAKVLEIFGDMCDTHDETVISIQQKYRADVVSLRERQEMDNKALEAEFSRVELEMQQEGSQQKLAATLPQALSLLTAIEQGYRKFHADQLALNQQYTATGEEQLAEFRKLIMEQVGVGTYVPPPEPARSISPTKGKGSKPSTAKKSSRPATRAKGEEEEPPPPHIEDVHYVAINDQRFSVVEAPDKIPCVQTRQEELEAAQAQEAEGEAEAPPDPEAEKKRLEAEKKKAAEAKKGGKTEPEPVPEPEPEPEAPAIDPFDPPLDDKGEKYVLAERVPVEFDNLGRIALRRAALVHVSQREEYLRVATSEECAIKQTEVTEELELLLRAHRPRAGRLELDVFESRQKELVTHQVRYERHVLSIAHKAHSQQARYVQMVADNESYLRKYVSDQQMRAAALSKAPNMATLLNLQRLAKVLMSSFAEEARARTEALCKHASDSATIIKIANARFAETLVPIDSGGAYNVEEAEAFKAKLADLDKDADERCSQWQDAARQQQTSHVESSVETFKEFEAQVHHHTVDLTVIEAVEKEYRTAEILKNQECSNNEVALASIDSDLDHLELLCTGSKRPSEDQEEEPLLANQILTVLHGLREKLLVRAKSMQCLQSTGLEIVPVELDLRNAPEPRPATPAAEKATKAAVATKAAPPAAKKVDPKAAKGKEVEPEVDSSTLLGAVLTIEASQKKKLEKICGDYYKEKGEREVSRPHKIPGTLELHLAQNAEEVGHIVTGAKAHLKAKIQYFRQQLARLSLLNARVPSVLFNDLMAVCRAQAEEKKDVLLSEFRTHTSDLNRKRMNNEVALKPGLGNPNRRAELDSLLEREAARSAEMIDACKKVLSDLLASDADVAASYFRQSIAAVESLLTLYDTTVQLPDLIPGEEDIQADRKSLKTLMKEHNRKMNASVGGTQEKMEGKAFPAITWPGIILGELHPTALASKGIAITLPEPGKKPASAAPTPEPVVAAKPDPKAKAAAPNAQQPRASIAPEPDTTFAIKSCDTPLHLQVIKYRDRLYESYKTYYTTSAQKFSAHVCSVGAEEFKWQSNWKKLYESLRQ